MRNGKACNTRPKPLHAHKILVHLLLVWTNRQDNSTLNTGRVASGMPFQKWLVWVVTITCPKLRRREYERPSTRLRHPQQEDWSPHITLKSPLQQALHRATVVKHCSMPPVTEPVGRDVVIIGGGICGILAARECQKRGLTYAILEREPQLGGNWYTKANAHSYLQVTAGWVVHASLAGGVGEAPCPISHQICTPLR